jgi:hypothetical protein
MSLKHLAPQIFRKGYPFLIVLALEAIFILYLVIGHRGVIGHDAFQYFGLQYYFLNNAVNSGETAQWMPLMTHGTVANWWYAVHASMLQGALLALGPLDRFLSGWNFLPIYYLGILFDLTVLLLGTWLLGCRYFASNLTRLFVCIAAVGSVTWFTQPWHNLHSYFALPLIFHFTHEFFETGRWRYFLLAGNLFVVQCCGGLPYYLPFTSLIVFLYALFYVVFFWSTAKGQIVRLLANWPRAVLPVGLVSMSLYAVSTLLTYGTDVIVNYNPGRLPDGSVTLDTFLSYGTNSSLQWFEVLSRVSPSLDYSLYFGYLAVAFAALALLLKRTKPLLVIASTTLIVLLIASATPVATFFYYVWPTMRYFRHLSLASTIVRLLLCFVAGFGFEQLLLAPAKEHLRRVRIAIFGMAQFAVMLLAFSLSYERALNWIAASVADSSHNDRAVLEESYLPSAMATSALWCVGGATFFIAVASRRFSGRTLAIAAVLFQAADIYSFKLGLTHSRTNLLTAEEYEVNKLQAMPYSRRRSPVDYDNDPRAGKVPQSRYAPGTDYWTADSYMFTDPPANKGRADHWLFSFDDYLRAYSGEELRDFEHKPHAFRVFDSLLFPTDNPAASRTSGITEDKIQFFSRAHTISSDREIAKLLASPASDGSILLLSGSDGQQSVAVEKDERLHQSYDVIQFDSNNIRIRVSGVEAGTWLYYADCWHPFWHATVNGKDVPVSKANLAYKAVPLTTGENIVHFRFHSAPVGWSIAALNWNLLIWVVLIPSIAVSSLVVENARR